MLGGIGMWQLLVVLAIVIILFGTKKIRAMGSDLGGFIKDFRKEVKTIESQEPIANDKPD